MKAIICTKFGPPEVLQIQEIPRPEPKENELLIKVFATSVNYGDLLARDFKSVNLKKFNMPFLFFIMAKLYFGFRKPKVKVLGSEFSGVVVATGKQTKSYRKGDEVFGYLGQSMGAYAEYICIPENSCFAKKPAQFSFEEAAVSAYGYTMAWGLMKNLGLSSETRMMVIGASGGIGSAVVQLAKHHFGLNVTGVCSTNRLSYVKALGADQVIDYSKEDFTKTGETYDVILDVLGKGSFHKYKSSLKADGRYLLASFKTYRLLQMLWTYLVGGKKVVCSLASGSREDFYKVKEWMDKGTIKPIVDRCFPAENASEAHLYVEDGLHKGKVAIVLSSLKTEMA